MAVNWLDISECYHLHAAPTLRLLQSTDSADSVLAINDCVHLHTGEDFVLICYWWTYCDPTTRGSWSEVGSPAYGYVGFTQESYATFKNIGIESGNGWCARICNARHGFYQWDDPGDLQDGDIRCKFRVGDSIHGAFLLPIGWGGALYEIWVDQIDNQIDLRYSQDENVIESQAAGFTINVDTWYWLRYRKQGKRHQAKIWQDGSAEPSAWKIDAVIGHALNKGNVGIGTYYSGTGSADYSRIDFISIASGAGEARYLLDCGHCTHVMTNTTCDFTNWIQPLKGTHVHTAENLGYQAPIWTDFSAATRGSWQEQWSGTFGIYAWAAERSPDFNDISMELWANSGYSYAVRWDTGGQHADVEILTRVLGETTAVNPRVYARLGSTAYWCTLNIDADTINLQKGSAASPSVVDSDAFSMTNLTWYYIRFRLVKNTQKIKVWAQGSVEPSAWNIEATDSDYPDAGYVGLGCYGASTPEAIFDFISVAYYSQKANTPLNPAGSDYADALTLTDDGPLDLPAILNVADCSHVVTSPELPATQVYPDDCSHIHTAQNVEKQEIEWMDFSVGNRGTWYEYWNVASGTCYYDQKNSPQWADTSASVWSAFGDHYNRRLSYGVNFFRDVEFLARVCPDSAGTERCSIYARLVPADAYYAQLDVDNNFLRICRGKASRVILGSHAHTISAGNWYWVRFRVDGNSLKAKIWDDGAAEPTSWDIDITDSTLTGKGHIALGQRASSSSYSCNDVLVVAFGQLTAPYVVNPGPPDQADSCLMDSIPENITLTESVPPVDLIMTDGGAQHVHSADNVVIDPAWVYPNNCDHAHSAPNLAINLDLIVVGSTHVLYTQDPLWWVNDCSHAHSADNIYIGIVYPEDCSHLMDSIPENIVLVQTGVITLTMQDAAHVLTSPELPATQVYPDDASHLHTTSDPIWFIQHATHAHSVTPTNLTLVEIDILTVANAAHVVTSPELPATQVYPADCSHVLTSPELPAAQVYPADCVHLHTAPELPAVQIYPDDCVHLHSADQISFIINPELRPTDCTHRVYTATFPLSTGAYTLEWGHDTGLSVENMGSGQACRAAFGMSPNLSGKILYLTGIWFFEWVGGSPDPTGARLAIYQGDMDESEPSPADPDGYDLILDLGIIPAALSPGYSEKTCTKTFVRKNAPTWLAFKCDAGESWHVGWDTGAPGPGDFLQGMFSSSTGGPTKDADVAWPDPWPTGDTGSIGSDGWLAIYAEFSVESAEQLIIQEPFHAHYAGDFVLEVELGVESCTHVHTADNVIIDPAWVHPQDNTHVIYTQDPLWWPAKATHVLTDDGPLKLALVVADSAHVHSSDNINLIVHLTVAASSHVHTAQTFALTQEHTLAPNPCTHVHTAGNVVLAEWELLRPEDCTHVLTGQVDVTQLHILGLDSCIHIHAPPNVALTQEHNLTLQDAFSLHVPSVPSLTQEHNLIVAPAASLHSIEAISLTVHLVVASCSHGITQPTISITQEHSLAVAGDVLVHTIPNLAMIVPITLEDCVHSVTSDSDILLTALHFLAVVGTNHVQVVTGLLILFQLHFLEVAGTGLSTDYNEHLLLSDNIDFGYLSADLGGSTLTIVKWVN